MMKIIEMRILLCSIVFMIDASMLQSATLAVFAHVFIPASTFSSSVPRASVAKREEWWTQTIRPGRLTAS